MVIFNNIILILEKYWGLFLQGIGVTLMLSAIAVVFGILIGSLLALMRLSKFHIGRFRPLDFIATIYVEIIRGTPLLLQLYFFFFLLPMMIPALETSAQFSITLALCLNSGAYVAEVIRAGISAVDKARWDSTPVRRCSKSSSRRRSKTSCLLCATNLFPSSRKPLWHPPSSSAI